MERTKEEMNEESTEITMEIPIDIEYVEPDVAGNDALDETPTTITAPSDTVIDLDPSELPEESTELLPEESTELTLEDVALLIQEESAAAETTVYDDAEILMKLDKIHIDLLFIVFLLLFFWLYERIKAGIRNMLKFTK